MLGTPAPAAAHPPPDVAAPALIMKAALAAALAPRLRSRREGATRWRAHADCAVFATAWCAAPRRWRMRRRHCAPDESPRPIAARTGPYRAMSAATMSCRCALPISRSPKSLVRRATKVACSVALIPAILAAMATSTPSRCNSPVLLAGPGACPTRAADSADAAPDAVVARAAHGASRACLKVARTILFSSPC